MMKKMILFAFSLFLVGCEKQVEEEILPVEEERIMDFDTMTIEEIVDVMTIQEKAGQMIQAERGQIQPHEVKTYNIGSILSGGGSAPANNTSEGWYSMIEKYQNSALDSSAGIPLMYGIDAVHGNNNLAGAVIFPHNIGLGAANDEELMKKIGRATGISVNNIGAHWNFAPAVSVGQNPQWGRYYESLSESSQVHEGLVSAYIEGLQGTSVAATAKHYIGDGGTVWNDASSWYKIDRGDVILTEEELREMYLPPYIEAIDAGVLTVMSSYNSFQGEKLHGHSYLINDVLKGELGFEGFVVSDWEGIHELPGTLYTQVVNSINAGNDMLMEPYQWKDVFRHIVNAVENGDITEDRINDAVTRILTVKKEMGLFETPNNELLETIEDYEIALEAVHKSAVLLKNDGVLPLDKSQNVLLLGKGSNSVGIQSGGWSLSWQGGEDNDLFGTTIQDGFISKEATIYTSREDVVKADVIVLVLSEKPYAEGIGDNKELGIATETAYEENLELINFAKSTGLPVVTILIAGRPLIVNEYLNDWNSFVMAHLPGSAGEGLVDLLYGETNFTGRLPYTWPKKIEQIGDTIYTLKEEEYQFDFGFGLSY